MILGLLAASAGQSAPLPENIQARIRDFPGAVSLCAKNLQTGVAVGIRESSPVRTASTIKLPIMAAVFDAVARGDAMWNQQLSGSVQLPLREAVRRMIVVSDNLATNMILDRFTADGVNAYLDRIGIPTTRALRKIRGDGPDLPATAGFSAAGKLPENLKYGLGVSTPRDMVAILEHLERGELVSPEASREMISVLKGCQDASGIRRRLGDLPVANKTGVLDALRSDVGIVYSKGGPIAVAITVDGMKVDYSPANAGSALIADLAKMLVDDLGR